MNADLRSFAGAVVVLMLLVGCGPGAGASATGRPTRAEIDRIESKLVMPDGAEPLGAYTRFYAATTPNGRRTIIAEFVLLDRQWLLEHRTILEKVSPSVFIVDENNMPGVMDGGCGVVTASYDPETGEMTPAECNGEA